MPKTSPELPNCIAVAEGSHEIRHFLRTVQSESNYDGSEKGVGNLHGVERLTPTHPTEDDLGEKALV